MVAEGGEGKPRHIPVLLNEVLEVLSLQPGENVVDCTVGIGGHAAAVLQRTSPNGRLLGMDLDEAALDAARRTLDRFGSRAMLVHESYRNVGRVLLSQHFGSVHAALLDAGFSSFVVDDPVRGFSFRKDGPLDMRYDVSQEMTAAEIVNGWDEDGLAKILWEYGEERYARRIAEAILRERRKERIIGTVRLAGIVADAVPAHYRRRRIHPATKTFQALRIAVNDELGNLETALPQLLSALRPGGRLAVITFHSVEDRIVKRFFRSAVRDGTAVAITKKPVVAGSEDVRTNPRSRSAKLRAIMKS